MAERGLPARPRAARTCVDTWVDLGRLGVLSARRAVRVRRTPSRWWSSILHTGSGVRLEPVSVDAALAWQALITSEGARPPPSGLTSSPLGGEGGGAAGWARRCVRLRGAARRGLAFPYLVYVEEMLAGEALAFTVGRTRTDSSVATSSFTPSSRTPSPRGVGSDRGGADAPGVGSIAQLLVWLAPSRFTVERFTATVEVLALHLFAGPAAPGRVIILVEAESLTVSALESIGFVTEGVLRDPPRPNRAVLVARRDAGAGADPPPPVIGADPRSFDPGPRRNST